MTSEIGPLARCARCGSIHAEHDLVAGDYKCVGGAVFRALAWDNRDRIIAALAKTARATLTDSTRERNET